MLIKNSQLVNFLNGVGGMQEKKLPIKVAHAIALNLKNMEAAAIAYEEERKKLASSYQPGDGDEELQELLSIETEIPVQTIKFSDLEKCDSDKFDALSVQDMVLLDFMTEK
ncbi:hypothetical protein [Hominifimenecus sp. rT4P-3]|uniref:hypothetical protein n=1 Tax=Hominifimenecus sp. rT4P-3 TaxID=3242979 RepID=UPI003DA3449C